MTPPAVILRGPPDGRGHPFDEPEEDGQGDATSSLAVAESLNS